MAAKNAKANPHRGDVTVSLKVAGQAKDFTLRPTWTAMVEIEQATAQGFISLVRQAATGGLGITEMTAVVLAGLRSAGEKDATADKIGQMIFETGLANVIAAVNPFLINALNGGEPPGEAEAADET